MDLPGLAKNMFNHLFTRAIDAIGTFSQNHTAAILAFDTLQTNIFERRKGRG
jgi:hypothetical protein